MKFVKILTDETIFKKVKVKNIQAINDNCKSKIYTNN